MIPEAQKKPDVSRRADNVIKLPSNNNTKPDLEGTLEGQDRYTFVPEGNYTLAYSSAAAFMMAKQNGAKIVLWFRIVDNGEYFGTVLPRFYNVKRLTKRGFVPYGRGDFMIEYCRICQPPSRIDRTPLSALKGHLILGEVRTVNTNRRQKELPPALTYSVVREIVGRKAL